jgi:ferredoxin
LKPGIRKEGGRRQAMKAPARLLPGGQGSPPPSSTPRVISWLRPPGALDERCTRCDECAHTCPPGAIRSVPERYGATAGTPWIDPARAPCQLCSDWPCISACRPAALALEGAAAMGTAHLVESSCLNRLGSPCSVCVEHCPVPGALALRGSLPVVESSLCTGCGLCAHACPAPARALIIAPREHRRAAAATVKVDQ